MENMKKRLDSSDTISQKSGINLDTEVEFMYCCSRSEFR